MMRRAEWLAAVKDSNSTKLSELLGQSAETADDGRSVGDSRDVGAVARAGPCAGFKDLKSLSDLRAEESNFKNCACKEDVKALNERLSGCKKLYTTLVSSCKASLTELRSAKTRTEAAAEAEKRKRARQEEADAKKMAKKKRTGQQAAAKAAAAEHPVFQLSPNETSAIPTSHAWKVGFSFDSSKPFVVSGVQDMASGKVEKEKIAQIFKDFAKAFNESSLKAS